MKFSSLIFVSLLFLTTTTLTNCSTPDEDESSSVRNHYNLYIEEEYGNDDAEEEDDDMDYLDNDENEDIVYTGMISSKKPTASPPPSGLSKTQSILVNNALPTKLGPVSSPPLPSFSGVTSATCKRWRCKLNGYTPIWKPGTPDSCSKIYGKLSMASRADCQNKYCEQVCAQF